MSDSIIDRIERYGVPRGESYVACPVCGDECACFFVHNDIVLGCENCIDNVDAAEWIELKGEGNEN